MSDKIKMKELMTILECMLKDELIAEIEQKNDVFFLTFLDGSRFSLTVKAQENK